MHFSLHPFFTFLDQFRKKFIFYLYLFGHYVSLFIILKIFLESHDGFIDHVWWPIKVILNLILSKILLIFFFIILYTSLSDSQKNILMLTNLLRNPQNLLIQIFDNLVHIELSLSNMIIIIIILMTIGVITKRLITIRHIIVLYETKGYRIRDGLDMIIVGRIDVLSFSWWRSRAHYF